MEKTAQENRNDLVKGLKAKHVTKNGKSTISFEFKSKFSLGYDGCGTHTHK